MMYNSYIMQRTQIYLSTEQAGRLAQRARAAGTTKSTLIREAIEEYLAKPDEDARRAELHGVLDDLARKPLDLPEGAAFVDALRKAEAAREAESVVVDTTIVIDLLRGHRPAHGYVLGLDEVPAASEITRVEVLRGVRSGERRVIERLLATFRWIAVDESVARRAGELGRRWRARHHGLATADLVIAATALEHSLGLATLNVRHFPMFEALEPPYGN
jgi:predicted nucleic acid-binding protein/predicted transcriptional regulator